MKEKITLFLLTTGFIVNSAIGQWASFPQFDNNRIAVGDIAVTGNSITVEALITMQDYSPVPAAYDIVSKHYGPPDVSYLFRPDDFAIQTDMGLTSVSHDIPLCFDSTYHVAGTYDGDSLRYFINGVQVASVAWTGNIFQNSLVTSIGNVSPDPSDYFEQFIGYIDEVRIWNIARSSNELSSNMYDLPNPASQSGLVAYYKFEGNYQNLQGNTAYDGVPSGASLSNSANPYYDGGVSESFCYPISVENLSNDDGLISVYPNPVSSTLNIVADKNITSAVEMVLTNMVGDVVLQQKLYFSSYSLSMENLPSGFYFLTLKNEDWIRTLKIVRE